MRGLLAPGRRKGDKSGVEASRRNNRGHYSVSFVETYHNLTEKDIELREKYGIDLISEFTLEDKKLIKLEEKKSTQTSLGRNEVFYVRKAKYNIGKLSISYKTGFDNKTTMTFTYQTRSISPPRSQFGKINVDKNRKRGSGTL